MNRARSALVASAVAAAVLASTPARASDPAPSTRPLRPVADPDPWLGPDKALHFTCSAALAGAGYGASALATDDIAARLAFGAAIALGAGVAKEALDATGFGDPSWRDLAWDVLGTAAGLSFSLSIDLAVRSARHP